MTGPIEPTVTLMNIAPDASLVLAWSVPSPTHVAVSVCIGTWEAADPSPTFFGNPVVVYVQLIDEILVVKERAVEVFSTLVLQIIQVSYKFLPLQCMFLRNTGGGEELARRRLNQLNDRLCLVTDCGETEMIPDEHLVSAYYEQDALRHGEDEDSHGYVMNLMLLRGY